MVLEGCLKSVYEKHIETILYQIPEVEKVSISIAYQKYLLDRYGRLLEQMKEEGISEQDLEQMVDESESKNWGTLSSELIKSQLLPDQKLEDLKFLSECAYQDACSCMKSKSFLSDQKEYEQRLYAISQCLDGISEYHVAYAKELLAETLLDVEYAYGKSEIKSLRLARTVDEIPQAIFCTECGVKNNPGSVFCKGCGTRLK